MMVLGIGGSPREKGNSDLMLAKVLQGVADQGVQTEALFLRDYRFDSCIGCEKCRQDKACTGLLDGMQLVYPKIVQSKGLVLASPTHNYNVTALMKGFIDRLYQFYDFTTDHPRAFSSRLAGQGRKAVLAAVCEQLEAKDMGFTLEAMEKPLQALGYDVLGQVSGFGFFHRGKVAQAEQVMGEAYALGKRLGLQLLGA